jgi:RimJ/RimL family protein N-acetyltransferase
MIQMALDPQALQIAANMLLREVGVEPCGDLKAIFWVNKDNEIEWVVGYTAFIGKTCQMHVVNLCGKPINRAFIHAAFDYPFNYCGIEKVLGVVNSNNVDAMRFDQKIGFKEVQRFEGLHDDGGDIVLFAMDKTDCRWIAEYKDEIKLVA